VTPPTLRPNERKRAPASFFRLVPADTSINFVTHFRLCVALSLGALVISAVAIPVRGIRLGVDFRGGYQIVAHVSAQPPASEGTVRSALSGVGFDDSDVVREGELGSGDFQIRFPATEGRDPLKATQTVREALESSPGTTSILMEKIDFVGPRVGAELRDQALKALAIAFALIFAYVAYRFAPSYAPGAVIALIHDVLITAGLFVVFGAEFDMSVVAALLTIIGYSINDTIVVFDRIRELRAKRTDLNLSAVVNLAVNDTLSRTLLTSGTTMLAVLALLVLGGSELRHFSTAMMIGIIVGTYSSVYIASPIMLLIEESGTSGRRTTPTSSPVERASQRRGRRRAHAHAE